MMNIDAEGLFKQLDSRPKSLLEFVEQNRLKNMQNEQNEMILRKQKRQEEFDIQSDPLKLAKLEFDNMNEQDKFVEQELLQGSIELQPLLNAKNSQGVMQSLQMRRNKLAQAGLRTDEIDNAIQLAQQGDFDTLKQLTGSQIQAGRAIGLLNDNTQNLPAGIQYQQKLAEARQMMQSSDPRIKEEGKNIINDIRQTLKIDKLPTGTTFDNQTDTISNIGGVEDALTKQKYAEQFGGSQGALPAFQEKSNIKVNEIRQTSDITTQNKISEKQQVEQDKIIIEAQKNYPKIEQQAEETLNLIDRLINDPSLYDAAGVLKSQMPTVFQSTKDFELLKEQLNNQVFLNAYESLRGAQGITDIEGLKATLAKLQSSSSGSPKLFIESAKNLQKQIIKSTRGAKNLADGNVFYKKQNNEQQQTTQQLQQSNQAQERIRTYNPQTQEFE